VRGGEVSASSAGRTGFSEWVVSSGNAHILPEENTMSTTASKPGADATAVRRLPAVAALHGARLIAGKLPELSSASWDAQGTEDAGLVLALATTTFDIGANRVLQLGLDSALTGLMAAAGAVVDVVEADAARLSPDTVDVETVAVQHFVGGIDDIPSQPSYDVIVSLLDPGVPVTPAFLDAIASRLLPAGRAVVAVRNSLARHALIGRAVGGIGGPSLSRGELQAVLSASSLSSRIGELTLGEDMSFVLVDREAIERVASASEAWLAWLARPALGSSAVGVDEHLWRGLSREGVGGELCDVFVVSLARGDSAPVLTGDGAVASFWNVDFELKTGPARVAVASGQLTIDDVTSVPLEAFSADETFSDRFGRSGESERRRLVLAWRALLGELEVDGLVPLAAVPHNMLAGVDGGPVLIDTHADNARAPLEEVLECGTIWLALEATADGESTRTELASQIGVALRLRPADIWIPAAIAAEARRLAKGSVGPDETEGYWVSQLTDHLTQPLAPAPAAIVTPDSALLVAQRQVEVLKAGAAASARVFEQQQFALASERNALRHQLHESRLEADAARLDSAALRNSRAFRAIASLRARVDRVAPWGTHRRGLYERSLRLAARAARIARGRRPAAVVDLARFTVPSSETPLITIVIPAYGHADYTIRCLRAIAAHHEGHEVEILVVDDASPDDAISQLRGIEGLHILELPMNMGFTRAANAGIAAARGAHVLMLNNDAEPTSGWITALLSAVEPGVGIVGAKLIYPDGRLQEAGGIIFNDASGWNYGKFDDPEDPRYTFRKEVDYCSGAAILMTKELLDVVPGFDERYAPAYYEDADMAFESRAHGLKVIYEPKAVVVHHEGISHGSDEGTGVKQYQIVNRDKFFTKWAGVLSTQRRPGEVALASIRRTGVGTIVLIDHMVPTWNEDAGSLRMLRLLRAMRGMGYDIVLLPENRHRGEPYTSELQSEGVLVWYGWGDLWTYLREITPDVAVAILSRASIASAFIRHIREVLPDTPIIFDTVDLHFLREQRRVDLGEPGARPRGVRATRELELALVRSAELTVVVSDAEKVLLEELVPDALIQVIPTAHDSVDRVDDVERTDITFVGSFQHDPNADAVRWLVAEIFPLITEELPNARLTDGSKISSPSTHVLWSLSLLSATAPE
jgi:GT2 family glycosyltransferase